MTENDIAGTRPRRTMLITHAAEALMEFRKLRGTDMELSTLSFGASSMGAEFRSIKLEEAFDAARVALDRGRIGQGPVQAQGVAQERGTDLAGAEGDLLVADGDAFLVSDGA